MLEVIKVHLLDLKDETLKPFRPLMKALKHYYEIYNLAKIIKKHFTLSEMEKSQTATRKGISNKAGSGEIKNLTDLCYEVLEPVRAKV